MKTIYVAEDGKTFENLIDCRNYEEKNQEKKISNEIIAFNMAGKKLKYDNEESLEDFLDVAYFLYVKTDEAMELLKKMRFEIESDKKLVYDEATEGWVSLEREYKDTLEKAKLYNLILRQFKKEERG